MTTTLHLRNRFRITIAFVVIATLLLLLFDSSCGFRYIVGDSVWSIPPYHDFYTNWSSSVAFSTGDSIVFEFESEFFNVIQVAKLDYESCTSLNPLKILTASPAIVILREEGVFYYICNISNYCHLGQKISIVVHHHYFKNHPPTPSPLPLPPPPLLQSFTPFLAPQPSPLGGINLSVSPVPCSTIAPSMVTNGSSNGASVPKRTISLGWIFALCFGVLFVLFVMV